MTKNAKASKAMWIEIIVYIFLKPPVLFNKFILFSVGENEIICVVKYPCPAKQCPF